MLAYWWAELGSEVGGCRAKQTPVFAHYWTWPVPDTVALESGVSQIWCQPAGEYSCIPGWLDEGPIVLELILLAGGQGQGLVCSQGWCGLSGERGWGPGDTGAGALPLASEVRSWDLWL